jgi:MFS family permease
LQDKLRPLAEAHAAVAACGQRRPLPFFGALVLSVLFLGVPAGLITGGLYDEYFSPIPNTSYPAPDYKYYDYRGSEITEVERDFARHRVIVVAVLLGVVTGVVLTALGTLLLAWWTTYRRLLVLAALGSAIVLGVPAGVGAGFLYQGFFGPVKYYKGDSQYYDYRGNALSWVDFTIDERKNIVQGVPIAAGTCLTLVVGVTALLLWRRSRRQARARQSVLDHSQEVLTAFPAVVQAWGGPARLHDPAFVQQALAGLESGPR